MDTRKCEHRGQGVIVSWCRQCNDPVNLRNLTAQYKARRDERNRITESEARVMDGNR